MKSISILVLAVVLSSSMAFANAASELRISREAARLGKALDGKTLACRPLKRSHRRHAESDLGTFTLKVDTDHSGKSTLQIDGNTGGFNILDDLHVNGETLFLSTGDDGRHHFVIEIPMDGDDSVSGVMINNVERGEMGQELQLTCKAGK
jgi:hypothetical protein